MYILVVNISHHASVCLLHNGDIVFFLEEERVSKIKYHGVGVTNLLKCLDILPVSTVDYLIITAAKPENFDRNSSIVDQVLNIKHKEYITYTEHHLFHASNAFYNSGFDEAVCLIMDGGGWIKRKSYTEVESLYNASYNKFEPIFKHYSTKNVDTEHSHYYKNTVLSDSLSCGNMFSRFTKLIRLGDEVGKFMGLSTYGSDVYSDDWFFHDEKTKLWRTNNTIICKELNKEYTSFTSKANLAYKVQKESKNHTIRLLEEAFQYNDKVVLSGGYFHNCVNNYEYIKYFPDKKFYIDPICHDGGTSIGAAKYFWHNLTNDKTHRKLETLYLG